MTLMRSARALLICTIVASGITLGAWPFACDTAYAANDPVPKLSDGDVVKIQKMVFTQIGVPPSETVIKWKNDIHIGVISDREIPATLLGEFTGYLSDVQRATGQNISFFAKGTNFTVVFSQDTQEDITRHEDILVRFFPNKFLYQQFFQKY